MKYLNKISYNKLGIFALIMALMPIFPEPHLVQKFHMALDGLLSKPLDVFDVFWHTLPIWIMCLKYVTRNSSVKEAK